MRNVHSMGWVFCWRMCRSALWSWWESVLRKYCMSGCGENGNAVGPVTGRHSPLYIDWSLKMEVSSCSGGTEFTFAPNLDKSEKKAIRERWVALVHLFVLHEPMDVQLHCVIKKVFSWRGCFFFFSYKRLQCSTSEISKGNQC